MKLRWRRNDRAKRAFGEIIGGNVFRKIDAVRKERKKGREKRRARERERERERQRRVAGNPRQIIWAFYF